jgi:DNA-binding Lrp family transcriptional regulator
MSLNEHERTLINHYQGGFPLIEQPFRSVADYLGCTERTLLYTLGRLLDSGVLSRFGPLYDAVKLGGGLTLAAMSVPEQCYDRVTEQVNGFDAVAHNYRRDHTLNMWFVIATASPEQIDHALQQIQQLTGFRVYSFPKQHEFYVGLWLKLDTCNRVTTVPLPTAITTTAVSSTGDYAPDELDRRIINATQAGLPLTNAPYQAIAQLCQCSSQQVKQRLQQMLEGGIIRRIGAVPNHYRLGLMANGMTVWDIPDDSAMALGSRIGQLDFVSHCYLRPRHDPVWPYNLFAMVHGRTRDEVDDKIEQIAAITGKDSRAHETLYSSAILKKTGMRLAA